MKPHSRIKAIEEQDQIRYSIRFFRFFVLIPFTVIAGIRTLGPPLEAPLRELRGEVAQRVPRLVGGFFLLLLGIGVYAFRGHFRKACGVIEYIFGAVVTWYALPKSGDMLNESSWFQVAAGIYVRVRGLDNVGKVVKDEKNIEWWKRRFGEDYK